MKRHDESISDRLRRMAATDELSVGRGRAEQIASRAMARASARPRLRSLAAAIAGTAFAVVSVTGLGAIADSAVPGDSLYPVDRAYEAVGRAIGHNVDRTQETIQEAITLTQRGDRQRAFLHVATELGSFIDLDDETDAAPLIDESLPAIEAVSEQGSTGTTIAAEPAVVASSDLAAVETQSAAPEEPVVEEGDPFLLALENALRATQAAAGTNDEVATAEANAAVKSVVKLAAGATDEGSGTQAVDQVAPGALAVPATTTTTTTTIGRGNGNGNGAGNSTTTTTTTSVPNDPEVPPGDGDTAGDDSGGSQEGSAGAGESGTSGAGAPGPIILPIP